MLVSTLYTYFLLLIHHFLTIYAVFQTITVSYCVDSITPLLDVSYVYTDRNKFQDLRWRNVTSLHVKP